MGGISIITSSIFNQKGSTAKFKSGVSSSILRTNNNIYAKEYIGFNPDTPLKVGSSSEGGVFNEWNTTTGTLIKLSASGDFNHFSFIEKQETGWVLISSGSIKGLREQSFVDIVKNEPGIYEYLILAMSTSSKQTVSATTTITVS
jgi:hypothetical protein